MDLSPPGSSVHGILQASILEWVAMPSVGEGRISLSSLADVISKALECIIALMPLALSEDSVLSLSRFSVFIKPPLPQSEGELMFSPPPWYSGWQSKTVVVELLNLEDEASPMFQRIKNLPAVQETQETWVRPWVKKIPRTRKWQPTLVSLPEESHGQRSLVGYSPRVA